jgi:hypothetical protein
MFNNGLAMIAAEQKKKRKKNQKKGAQVVGLKRP